MVITPVLVVVTLLLVLRQIAVSTSVQYAFGRMMGYNYVTQPMPVGANKLSLEQARIHFAQHGTCEPGLQQYVRSPLPDELPD